MVTSAQAYWLNRKRRQKRNAAEETPPLSVADFFGATSGFYPISLATCFKDTACTIPCTADGDLIKGITPLYGELPNLIQATDANCFILRDDGGGRWRADFDATDTMVSAASVTVARQHLIGLARELASAGTSILFGVVLNATNYHRIQNVSSSDRNAGAVRTTAGGVIAVNSPASQFPLNTPLVASSRVTDTGVDIQADEGVITEAATVMALNLASAAVTLGPFGVAGKVWGFYVHRAAEISAEERTVANSALAALQGRTL